MRKTLTITDVTEMRDDEVCIAGIDDVGFCVRPVVPGGVRLHHLYNRGSAVVVPGRNVEFDLFEAKIEPPHIEDERFFPSSIVDKGRCTPHEWENVLAGAGALHENGRRCSPLLAPPMCRQCSTAT